MASGNIRGTVEDSTGAVIPNAKVTLLHLATHQTRYVETNERGEFFAPLLPIGRYDVSAEFQRFKRSTLQGIQLLVDQTVVLSIRLDPGEISQTVQVQSHAPLVNTENPSVGQVIENDKVVDMPLNGRNVFALGLLAGNTTEVTGIGSNQTFAAGGGIFADRNRDVWISISGYDAKGLLQWERRTGRIRRFCWEDGLPEPIEDDRSLASAFAEDLSGTLWIGFHRGGLFRFRSGRLVPVRPQKELPLEGVRWIHRDAVGRLWIAGRKGLLRINEPGMEQPEFRRYGIDQGLASSSVLSITEDDLGRIYIGSGRGVDRLDPDTGNVHHFGAAEGLVGGEIRVADRDKQGYLWFGSSEGLSRYDPSRHSHRKPGANR
jgi:hypothetical protein